jgi:GNAT superfamily N-acetyltransferase
MASLEGWGSTIELHPRAPATGVPVRRGRGQYGRMLLPSEANSDAAVPSTEAGPGGRVRVRLAAVADARTLAEINVLTWRAAYREIVPAAYLDSLDIERMHERWIARIEGPADRVNLLAEVDGRVAAYAVVGSYRAQHDAEPEDTTGWGELYAIYTRPELQGRGAGQAVHDAALGALVDRGFGTVALWVLRENAKTQRWYANRGWRADGASSQWLGAGVPLEEIRLSRTTNGSFRGPSSRLGR